MKSKIIKYSTAAVIVIVSIIILNQVGVKVDVTNKALAEVLEKINKMPWLHQVINGTEDNNKVVTEQWVSFDSKICAIKSSVGYRMYYDYNEKKLWNYDSQSQTVTVTHSENVADSVFKYDSISSFLGIAIEEFKQEGAKVDQKMGMYNGKSVLIFDVTIHEGQLRNITFFVDPKSKLIIAEKFDTIDKDGNVIMKGENKLEYPETGPSSIYDLGIPKDAKIINDIQDADK